MRYSYSKKWENLNITCMSIQCRPGLDCSLQGVVWSWSTQFTVISFETKVQEHVKADLFQFQNIYSTHLGCPNFFDVFIAQSQRQMNEYGNCVKLHVNNGPYPAPNPSHYRHRQHKFYHFYQEIQKTLNQTVYQMQQQCEYNIRPGTDHSRLVQHLQLRYSLLPFCCAAISHTS